MLQILPTERHLCLEVLKLVRGVKGVTRVLCAIVELLLTMKGRCVIQPVI